MFAVDDLDDTLARLRRHGAQLVDEVVQYEDVYGSATSEAPRAFSSGWPSKSADARHALRRHSRTLAQARRLPPGVFGKGGQNRPRLVGDQGVEPGTNSRTS
jgi:hypothetical protein